MTESLVLTSDCILTITLTDGYSGVLRLNYTGSSPQNYTVVFSKGSDSRNVTITVWYDVLSNIKLSNTIYLPITKIIIDRTVILGDSKVFIEEVNSEYRWFSVKRFTGTLPGNISTIVVSNIPSIRVFVGV